MKVVVDNIIAVPVPSNIFNDTGGGRWCLFGWFSFALKGKYFCQWMKSVF